MKVSVRGNKGRRLLFAGRVNEVLKRRISVELDLCILVYVSEPVVVCKAMAASNNELRVLFGALG